MIYLEGMIRSCLIYLVCITLLMIDFFLKGIYDFMLRIILCVNVFGFGIEV